MTQAQFICKIHAIADPGAREAVIDSERGRVPVFVVKKNGDLFAYVNRCPHKWLELNWEAHRFLGREGAHIICANHAALFRIADGFCIAGPCSGARLIPISVELRAEDVYVKC